MSSSKESRAWGMGIAMFVFSTGILYYALRNQNLIAPPLPNKNAPGDEDEPEDGTKTNKSKGLPFMGYGKSDPSPSKTKFVSSSTSEASTSNAPTKNSSSSTKSSRSIDEIHKLIEEADKRGKAYFKDKKFLEAASCFTEAIDIVSSNSTEISAANNRKQLITLTNNRSAMYEKGGLPELVLIDCDRILELDMGHQKARLRKLRVLEGQERFMDALIEVCVLQLKFMSDNRENLRLGIPMTPPIPQSKVDELMGKILVTEVPKYFNKIVAARKENPDASPLPSVYTVLQLLKSFSGYNSWMAAAASEGDISTLSKNVDQASDDIEKAKWLWKRGRRYAYENQFELACNDFNAAYEYVQKLENGEDLFGEELPRLLEWVGMCRHLKYNLDAASECYEKCCELEPNNSEIFVKRAGVKMDGADQEAAMKLFNSALDINPNATDALLHRANLYMLQSDLVNAKRDLERAIRIEPNHLLAYLRLATVYMTEQDLDGANSFLKKAEKINGDSSEVHSYRGEMHFAKGELAEANAEFEKAIESDSKNATPYVNSALAIMNIPGPDGRPDLNKAIELLEKGLDIDPSLNTAYVHLGQLKLALSTNLADARKVLDLYDKGIENCSRTVDEVKEIVSMRILTVAQIDAATALKMETLGMQ